MPTHASVETASGKDVTAFVPGRSPKLRHASDGHFATRRKRMLSTHSTRRKFGTVLASLVSGLGITSASANALAAGDSQTSNVEKLGDDGKAGSHASFIMPIVRHNGLIYVA